MRRRETLGRLVLLSLALHLTVFLSLLTIQSTQPPIDASEPLSVDVVVEQGPAQAAPGPPAPTEAPAAPMAPAAPVPQAEIPAPAPNVPPPPLEQAAIPPPPAAPDVPPPLVQQVEVPPPTPVATPPTAAAVPPPPPVQQAEIPLPAPAPMPVPPQPPPPPLVAQAYPPPRPPVTQAHPTPAPPQRVATRPTAARSPATPVGSPAQATDGQNAASRASAANNGAAWMGKLKQWWDQHSFYPKEASQTNEGGNVRVHIAIAPDGQVTSIDVVQGSGSSVLDTAAIAVFRNARLPPFPPGTPVQPADVVVTLHYHPADGGG